MKGIIFGDKALSILVMSSCRLRHTKLRRYYWQDGLAAAIKRGFSCASISWFLRWVSSSGTSASRN